MRAERLDRQRARAGVRRFRPTSRRPTARSPGIRPRSSWSRCHGGGEIGLGYTYSGASIAELIDGKLATTIAGHGRVGPAGGVARDAARRAQPRPGRACRDRDLCRRCRAARSEGAPARPAADQACSAATATQSRSMAAAASPPIRTRSFKSSSAAGWNDDGCAFVKMKVGTASATRIPGASRWPSRRSATARRCSSMPTAPIAVQQALELAPIALPNRTSAGSRSRYRRMICAGLRAIAQRARRPEWTSRPANMPTRVDYVREMLEAQAVDVQQADVTRCGGITAFLQIAALCDAFHIDLSGHCAPALHLHVACASPRLRHLEWFHDHVRIEHMLFDGAPAPKTARSGRICRGPATVWFQTPGRGALRRIGNRMTAAE